MESISYVGSLFKMLLALAVVLAMMVGTVYLLKSLLGRTATGGTDGDIIRILAAKSLGPRSSIMIIETLGKITVIGVSGGQMHPLTTIDEPAILDKIGDLRQREPVRSPVMPIDALREKIVRTFKRK